MSYNSFGEAFRLTTFGESHGAALGVVIDGVRPGLLLDVGEIQSALDRRRPGQSSLVSSRREPDRVEVLSGVFEGRTTGAPICLVVYNVAADPVAYERLRDLFRPGHADLTYLEKYGIRDFRGGGRASGRETVARVAAGAVAMKLLQERGVTVTGFVREIGGVTIERFDRSEIDRNPLRCPDPEAAADMASAVEQARSEGDSVGGIVEVIATGVPAGWGDPVFAKLDAQLASALMSIGAVKGVEVGAGFELVRLRGSEANDAIKPTGFPTNRHGGVLGGISSGADVVVRVAVKPTPSVAKPQKTVDTSGVEQVVQVTGRHDPCICPRLVPVAEAMVALVLVDAMLRQRALRGDEVDAVDLVAGIERLDRSIIEAVALRRQLRQRLDEIGPTSVAGSTAAERRALGAAHDLPASVVDRLFSAIEGGGG